MNYFEFALGNARVQASGCTASVDPESGAEFESGYVCVEWQDICKTCQKCQGHCECEA
jgi:hypothetical protein